MVGMCGICLTYAVSAVLPEDDEKINLFSRHGVSWRFVGNHDLVGYELVCKDPTGRRERHFCSEQVLKELQFGSELPVCQIIDDRGVFRAVPGVSDPPPPTQRVTEDGWASSAGWPGAIMANDYIPRGAEQEN